MEEGRKRKQMDSRICEGEEEVMEKKGWSALLGGFAFCGLALFSSPCQTVMLRPSANANVHSMNDSFIYWKTQLPVADDHSR